MKLGGRYSVSAQTSGATAPPWPFKRQVSALRFSSPLCPQRTSNALERLNQEIKRRTRVASLFPNEASLIRLVSAILCEIDEDWISSKVYLNMNPSDTAQI